MTFKAASFQRNVVSGSENGANLTDHGTISVCYTEQWSRANRIQTRGAARREHGAGSRGGMTGGRVMVGEGGDRGRESEIARSKELRGKGNGQRVIDRIEGLKISFGFRLEA